MIDYCSRNLVQLSEVDNADGILPGGKPLTSSTGDGQQHLAWLTLLANHENKTVEWLVAFSSECERRRWLESVTPTQTSLNPEEKIYEEWDCPLVKKYRDFSISFLQNL